jgi:3-hydroxyisobutyrate dehydrogenase
MKRILADDYSRHFALDLFTKDLKIAADLGDEQKVKAPLTHLVHDRMREARDAIDGHGDHTTAFRYWEKQVG